MSMYESDEWELPGELEGNAFESGEEFESDELELELAQELTEITSEAELEEFIGKLVRSAVKGAGRFVSSPLGKAVGGVLRGVAKTALPALGGAIGSFVAPGVGTMIGGRLGSMASKLLEVEELEVLAEEEAEFEAARRFVQFGRATARNAVRGPRNRPPRDAARAAAIAAARRYAPALLRGSGRGPSSWRPRRRPPRRPPTAWAQPGYAWVDTGYSDPGDPYAGASYAAAPEDSDGDGDVGPADGVVADETGGNGMSGRWVRRPDGILLVGA